MTTQPAGRRRTGPVVIGHDGAPAAEEALAQEAVAGGLPALRGAGDEPEDVRSALSPEYPTLWEGGV